MWLFWEIMVAIFTGEQWLSDPQSTKAMDSQVTHRKSELGLLDSISVEGHLGIHMRVQGNTSAAYQLLVALGEDRGDLLLREMYFLRILIYVTPHGPFAKIWLALRIFICRWCCDILAWCLWD